MRLTYKVWVFTNSIWIRNTFDLYNKRKLLSDTSYFLLLFGLKYSHFLVEVEYSELSC